MTVCRNTRHQWDDVLCPYDLQDGWEYLDPATGSWLPDGEISVTCVHPNL